MIKKLIAFTLMLIAIPLSAMEKPLPAKKSAKEQAQALAQQITLISQEKNGETNSFRISRAVAERSGTIRNLLTGITQSANVIPFTNISGKTLEEVVHLLNALYEYRELQGKKLLDALDTKVAVKDPLELLKAVNYLDIPILVQLAARQIAGQEAVKSTIQKIYKIPLVQQIKTAFGASAPAILKLIEHYYVLVNGGKHIDEIPQDSYGFSLRDYLDYTPDLIAKRMDNERHSLNLSGLQLRDLNGLENLPQINLIKSLNLSQNQLTKLPNFIINLPHLDQLNIFQTKIRTIDPELFKLLKNK